jgi:hypothetical protein
MAESTPNPIRDVLPATTPAATEASPSMAFQPIVMYSNRLARRESARRSRPPIETRSPGEA